MKARERGDGRVYRRPGKRFWMLDYWAPGAGRHAGHTVRVRESSGTEDEEKAAASAEEVEAARSAKSTGGFVETPSSGG